MSAAIGVIESMEDRIRELERQLAEERKENHRLAVMWETHGKAEMTERIERLEKENARLRAALELAVCAHCGNRWRYEKCPGEFHQRAKEAVG